MPDAAPPVPGRAGVSRSEAGRAGISRRGALGALAAWAAFPAATRAGGAAVEGEPAVRGEERLPREDLMVYRSRSGEVRRVRSAGDWRRRRAEIVAGFESVAGRLPGSERRVPLELRVEEEHDLGEVVRQRITYQVEPGERVESWLMMPSMVPRGRRSTGVLCLHQTHPAGKRVVVGLGNSPDDEYAVELAGRGMVCLAPPYPLLADYQPDLGAGGWKSGTLKAVWDNQRGLDVLESLPYVRPGVFGAIGHSLGGHNAIFTALLEPRIKAVVTSCAFDQFVDYMGGNIGGWIQDRYLPRLEAYRGRPADIPFDFSELIASLAPRAFFASAPLGDSNFRWTSVDRIFDAARPVYALLRASDRLELRHPEGPHRFPPELRLEAYAFLERQLSRA